MKSGISLAVSAVTRLGSPHERDYMLELGVWPHKSKHARLWLSLMVTGEGRSDYMRTWSLKLPQVGKHLHRVGEGLINALDNVTDTVRGWLGKHDKTTDI